MKIRLEIFTKKHITIRGGLTEQELEKETLVGELITYLLINASKLISDVFILPKLKDLTIVQLELS